VANGVAGGVQRLGMHVSIGTRHSSAACPGCIVGFSCLSAGSKGVFTLIVTQKQHSPASKSRQQGI
jgi:hypothetical protein